MTRLPLILLLVLAACGEPKPVDPIDDGGVQTQEDAGTQDAGTDAGSDAGNSSSCTRLAQTQTADIALLDQVRQQIASATSDNERNAKVDAFIAAVKANGGTPLQQSDGGTRVAFIAVDPPSSSYSVPGEWNSWTAGATSLSQVGTSKLYAAELNLPRDRAYAYKMADGTNFYEDRRAMHVGWDGIQRSSIGEFNELVYPEKQDATKGRLIVWRGVPSTSLNSARDVFVYLPARYDDGSCAALPSLYFHDGNESITRGHFDAVASIEYASHPNEASVLVFVALPDQNIRLAEYMPYPTTQYPDAHGDQYLQMLVSELVPKISDAFRLCSKAEDRGISGASLGGLISGRAGFQHSGTFGYVGSQSGSYFWDNGSLITRAGGDPKVPVRWYVDYGCQSGDLTADNCDVNRQLVTALQGKGYSVVSNEEAGGQHDWAYWEKRMPLLLSTFRAGKTGCAP